MSLESGDPTHSVDLDLAPHSGHGEQRPLHEHILAMLDMAFIVELDINASGDDMAFLVNSPASCQDRALLQVNQ